MQRIAFFVFGDHRSYYGVYRLPGAPHIWSETLVKNQKIWPLVLCNTLVDRTLNCQKLVGFRLWKYQPLHILTINTRDWNNILVILFFTIFARRRDYWVAWTRTVHDIYGTYPTAIGSDLGLNSNVASSANIHGVTLEKTASALHTKTKP